LYNAILGKKEDGWFQENNFMSKKDLGYNAGREWYGQKLEWKKYLN